MLETIKSKTNVIRVSKSGVFSIEKFKLLYEKHDLTLEYQVLDALRNRFDDLMMEEALQIMGKHSFHTMILVSFYPIDLYLELQ